jgi:5-methylthioadenosine/S-adenosylhomocysteine deaminase
VYAAGREHVTHVWVDGRARVADRSIVGIDQAAIADKARWWSKRLA